MGIYLDMPQIQDSTIGQIRIGTSAWMNKDWGETFYPKELTEGHLTYFAERFPTVEVNTTFYHLPRKSTFQKWTEETPEDFVFAVKLSRYITHRKRLEGIREPLERFIKRASPMKEKLGVILVQLPPFLKYSKPLLRSFVESARVVTLRNYPVRFALEPRHVSWKDAGAMEDIRALLKEAHIGLVFAHSANIMLYSPEQQNITSDFVYVRFHGPGEFGASRYGSRRLRPWAERMVAWSSQGLQVFAYFNNDEHGHAIHDARTLQFQIEKAGFGKKPTLPQ